MELCEIYKRNHQERYGSDVSELGTAHFQDDCSTDNTKDVVEIMVAENPECKDKLKYECNPKNSGAAITRNNAPRRAKGRWIAFLDSDDLWLPEKLEKQLRFMVDNGYKFSYTAYREMDNDSRETGVEIHGPKHVSKLGMFASCWPGCLTVMYDREAVGLVQIADIKKNNDYAMWLKVCRKADCHLLDEVLARYHRGRWGSVFTHGYSTMIHWHYKLWHEAEGMNAVASMFWTCMNLVCGVYKKIIYSTEIKNKVIMKNSRITPYLRVTKVYEINAFSTGSECLIWREAA